MFIRLSYCILYYILYNIMYDINYTIYVICLYFILYSIILHSIVLHYITLHYIILTKNKNKESSSLISLSSFRLLFGRGFGHVKGHPSPAIQGLGRNSIPLPTVKMPKMAMERGNHGEMAFQLHFNGNSISIKIDHHRTISMGHLP